jgi:hypothetical protein
MPLHLPGIVLLLSLLSDASAAADLSDNVKPLGELPPHLRFEDGRVNLVADYAAAMNGYIPVYIVNSSSTASEHVPLDIFWSREMQYDDGTWHRCEPVFEYFGDTGALQQLIVKIPPGSFYPASFDRGSEGVLRKVRIVDLGLGLRSNEGTAIVDLDEAMASRFDIHALKRASFEELAKVALGEVPAVGPKTVERLFAITSLNQFNQDPRAVDVLKQVAIHSRNGGDERNFKAAMRSLLNIASPDAPPETAWEFTLGEVKSGKAPWGRVALESLFESPHHPKRKLALSEQIMANPGHPFLEVAIDHYSRLALEGPAYIRLRALMQNPAYTVTARAAARAAYDRLAEANASPKKAPAR